ncbi:MAG: hypothetical protein N4A74_26640 [Carboxylicivirga sp.]|jgi:hypothetical protein|nr:hypothetical protein [Carboxylicivirga sp.]
MASSKKRKQKKSKPVQQSTKGSAKKNYLLGMYDFVSRAGCEGAWHELTKAEKEVIFGARLHMSNLKRDVNNPDISKEVLDDYGGMVKYFYEHCSVKIDDVKGDILCKYFIGAVRMMACIGALSVKRKEYLEERFKRFKNILKANSHIGLDMLLQQLQMMLAMNNRFDENMYVIDLDFCYRRVDVPGLYFTQTIRKIAPRISSLKMFGCQRPVFQVGFVQIGGGVKWRYVPARWLGEHYNGDKTHLPICLQSHAIKRYYERNDGYHQRLNNFFLFMSFKNEEDFCFDRNRLFIAIKIRQIKVGYFVGDVIGNRVIMRTFLFVTHQGTPEGKKLSSISGLSKADMSYWRIDRLSAFLDGSLEKEDYIKGLFERAGLSDLFKLRDLSFEKEMTTSVDAGSLVEFINEGKQEIEDDWYADEWWQDAMIEV